MTLGGFHRAMVRGDGFVKVCSVTSPSAVEREIVVRPLVSGVCGTDLQILSGQRDESSSILGHEGIVEVVEVASSDDTTLLGRRFAINPTDRTTGEAVLGHNTPGLWQEKLLIPPEWQGKGLFVEVPSKLDPELGPLLEPVAVALYALEIVESLSPDACIAIIGNGTIGRLMMILAGPARAALFSSSGDRSDGKPLQNADAAVVCTTREKLASAIDTALALLKPFGCLDVITGPRPEWSHSGLTSKCINKIRRANCAGYPSIPEYFRTVSADNKPIRVVSQRGVSSRRIKDAAMLLVEQPERFRGLVTVIDDPHVAAQALSEFISAKHRNWIKLGLDVRRW